MENSDDDVDFIGFDNQLISPKQGKNSVQVYSKWQTIISTRFIVAYMGFFGFFLVYSMRINISVALVDMVMKHSENASVNENCPVDEAVNKSDNGSYGKPR